MSLRTAIINKTLRGCEYFRHQLRRSGFRVGAQQRLRSRSTKQDPRFRSVAVCRRIQKQLDAIQTFFLYDAIAPKLCVLSARAR